MASTQPTPQEVVPAETASRARRGRFVSSDRIGQLAFVLGCVLLETIPVAAWLQTGGAIVAGDPGLSALPLWYLVLIALLAAWVGHATDRRGPAAAVLSAVLPYGLSFIVAMRISPAAYGSVVEGPFGTAWVRALGADLYNGHARLGALLGLAILLVYLWWRGLSLGRRQPTVEATRRLFYVSFGALVLSLAIATAAHGQSQVALAGRLAFLLLLEAFSGLATLSIARTNTIALQQRTAVWTGSAERGPWLSLGLAISAVTLLVSMVASLIFSYNAVIAGLSDLGPLGALIAAGLEWLLYGIAYLLSLVVEAPFEWIINHVRQGKNQPFQPPQPPKGSCPNPSCIPNVPPARGIAVAVILGVLLVVAIALLLYIVYRVIKASTVAVLPSPSQEEERESLDARSLFGAQLRDLFARRRHAPAPEEEALAPGSVRAVYRDVLRAAETAGVPRSPAETPDEYRTRLERATAAADDDSAGALGALTAVYDRSRYGEQEPPEEEWSGLRAQARRLITRLRALRRPAGIRGV